MVGVCWNYVYPEKPSKFQVIIFFNCESGVDISTLDSAFALKSITRSIRVDVQITMIVHTFQSCPSLGTSFFNININEFKSYILVLHLTKKRKVEYMI